MTNQIMIIETSFDKASIKTKEIKQNDPLSVWLP